MEKLMDWLLAGEPWVEYRTRLDLLNQKETDPEVAAAKTKMVGHPKIVALVAELQDWPGTVISSHKSAGQPFHKLAFLADLGLNQNDPGVAEIIGKVMAHQSEEGPFTLPTNVPKHFGGSGKDEWGWALCDAPTLVYALAKFGLTQNSQVQKAAAYIAGLGRDNGFPCAVSKELGSFHGPGRKEDPCPYATLISLKALQQFPKWQNSNQTLNGAESLLNLWSNSRQQHPYIFYMGTDFRKLKAPNIWYDILHVLDVLSGFRWLRSDPRIQEMAEIVESKADKEGRYTPESVWQAWKDWDFGQKKQPSQWLTLQTQKILKRTKM
ncbi:MAG: hypothetical protein NWE92_06015 [Candidatus Bathyarchaeota archaeon]|nr:hypothetical protein [Candidatus Bathyarchaeota archaeon]